MKVCVSIAASGVDAALAKMKRATAVADLLELRIDLIPNADLARLLASGGKNIVVTNRRKEEGGAFQGTERERVDVLKEAICLGAGYVDIEAKSNPLLIEELCGVAAKRRETKLIVSSHDLARTPGERRLKEKLDGCLAFGADIVKIVTTAGTAEDNLKVLSLIPYARRKGVEIIAFCMGEAGRLSRIMAPLLGSFLTFASLEKGEETAPGQFTAVEMKQIFEKFRV
jgi:3-dehydroquinate dehydratase type I